MRTHETSQHQMEQYSKPDVRHALSILRSALWGRVLERFQTRPNTVRQELVAPAKYKLERLINIKEGERGHDYRLIFGPYLKGAQEIILREPYLENVNQCQNLRDFLELAWSQSRKLKRVTLVTKNELRGKYPGVRSSLIRLAQDLNKKGVRLETRYDNYIHDRLLKIDSQWEIGLSRGLDIFYTHHGRGLGNSQQALRACRETRITVLQSVKA